MFRSLGKSKIAFVLAILFGISLFFFKGGSRYSNLFNSDTVVATVSGTPISTSKFNRTMQMNINKFNQMLGKPMTGDEIRSFQIHSLSLGALINDAVFENEYDSIKLIIDESVIAQKTKERIPQLYDKNNKLNETYLNTFLKQQQLKIEDIVQIINFETRDEFVNNALFNINYPQYFSSKIDNYNNHSRKISYIEFLLEEVNIENDIQKYALNMKEELEKYYENNINQYMSKENRNVEYIIFNKKKYANNFVPTNFEIKEYFNANNINPIICIGETFEEKNQNLTKDIIYTQISKSVPKNATKDFVIIAYEPIWAIGTGKIPSLEEIDNIHSFIKNEIQNIENYKILYGGSVNSNNASEIMDLKNVDGVLVGGASLDALEYKKIMNS